jgi:uncharacterized membrane protein YfcA
VEGHILAALALSTVIGLTLGLLGGGGSILAVPVLVYVARVAPADAIGMSLIVVGATSVVAGAAHARAGRVDWRAAVWFGGAGLLSAFLGARLTSLMPARLLLFAFALLMILVGAWMRFGSRRHDGAQRRAARPRAAALAGFAVGGVTGFLGVGGGFLIVPALIAFTGLGVREAVGTSLVVIAMNSAAGALGHLGRGDLHLPLAAVFTIAAICGALGGERLARRFSTATLRGGFALFVVAVGVAMALRITIASG